MARNSKSNSQWLTQLKNAEADPGCRRRVTGFWPCFSVSVSGSLCGLASKAGFLLGRKMVVGVPGHTFHHP